MGVSIEEMKSCIQEWFAETISFEDLRNVYFEVRSEVDKQFEYMANTIAKERARDGQYDNEV